MKAKRKIMTNPQPKHPFRPILIQPNICVICGESEASHNEIQECEVSLPNCTKTPVLKYKNMFFCKSCLEREQQAEAYAKLTPDERVEYSRKDFDKRSVELVLRDLDSSVQIRTDLFNADVPSIVELKKIIENDENIPKDSKNKAFAEACIKQFEILNQAAFEKRQQYDKDMLSIVNRQKSIQVFLNDFAAKLRQEERDALRLQDLKYQPVAPKAPKVKSDSEGKTRKTAPKFDRDAIVKVLAEFPHLQNVFSVQALCTQMGMTPDNLANFLRRSIAEAKSELS